MLPERIACLARAFQNPSQHEREHRQNSQAADHAKFMRDDAENEVGVADSQETAGVLGTNRVALAQESAGADADPRLIDIVGGIRDPVPAIDKRVWTRSLRGIRAAAMEI